MSMPLLIDDLNPAVQYSLGWISEENLPTEVDHTRHGAAVAGLTATLAFIGECLRTMRIEPVTDTEV